jgi:DNA-binding Lrp family transcriptional regulator
VKDMAKKLDSLTADILYSLDLDSKQKITSLAKKLKKSPQRIEYNIKRLQENGVIKNYIAVVDYSKIGPYAIYLYGIKLSGIKPDEEKKIVDNLKEQEDCLIIYKTEGLYDLMIGVIAKNIVEAKQRINNLLNFLEGKIENKKLYIITRFINFSRDYLYYLCENDKCQILPKPKKIIIDIECKNEQKIKVDKKDEEILRILAKNCRTELIQIAKQVNLTPEAVWKRIKNIEKNKLIAYYTVLLSPEKYEHKFYFFEIELDKKIKMEDIKGMLIKHPQTFRILQTMEEDIYVVQIVCKDEKEKEEIKKEIMENFGDKIKEITINRILKIECFRYF